MFSLGSAFKGYRGILLCPLHAMQIVSVERTKLSSGDALLVFTLEIFHEESSVLGMETNYDTILVAILTCARKPT